MLKIIVKNHEKAMIIFMAVSIIEYHALMRSDNRLYYLLSGLQPLLPLYSSIPFKSQPWTVLDVFVIGVFMLYCSLCTHPTVSHYPDLACFLLLLYFIYALWALCMPYVHLWTLGPGKMLFHLIVCTLYVAVMTIKIYLTSLYLRCYLNRMNNHFVHTRTHSHLGSIKCSRFSFQRVGRKTEKRENPQEEHAQKLLINCKAEKLPTEPLWHACD